MKLLKFTFFALFLVTLISCNDNEEPAIAFGLNSQSIAGTYNMSGLSKDVVTTTVVNNTEIKISDEEISGDIFKIDFILNANGTYTVAGSYTTRSRLTPVGSNPVNTDDILNIQDSGTFTINVGERTMTFISSTKEFLDGTFSIATYNENSFSVKQESVAVAGSNTSTTNATYTFTRK